MVSSFPAPFPRPLDCDASIPEFHPGVGRTGRLPWNCKLKMGVATFGRLLMTSAGKGADHGCPRTDQDHRVGACGPPNSACTRVNQQVHWFHSIAQGFGIHHAKIQPAQGVRQLAGVARVELLFPEDDGALVEVERDHPRRLRRHLAQD